jgi:hypothetical protein
MEPNPAGHGMIRTEEEKRRRSDGDDVERS